MQSRHSASWSPPPPRVSYAPLQHAAQQTPLQSWHWRSDAQGTVRLRARVGRGGKGGCGEGPVGLSAGTGGNAGICSCMYYGGTTREQDAAAACACALHALPQGARAARRVHPRAEGARYEARGAARGCPGLGSCRAAASGSARRGCQCGERACLAPCTRGAAVVVWRRASTSPRRRAVIRRPGHPHSAARQRPGNVGAPYAHVSSPKSCRSSIARSFRMSGADHSGRAKKAVPVVPSGAWLRVKGRYGRGASPKYLQRLAGCCIVTQQVEFQTTRRPMRMRSSTYLVKYKIQLAEATRAA